VTPGPIERCYDRPIPQFAPTGRRPLLGRSGTRGAPTRGAVEYATEILGAGAYCPWDDRHGGGPSANLLSTVKEIYMAPSIHGVLAGSARVAVTVSMNFGRAGSRSYVPVHPLPRVKGMHYRRTLRSITDSGVPGGDRRRLAPMESRMPTARVRADPPRTKHPKPAMWSHPS